MNNIPRWIVGSPTVTLKSYINTKKVREKTKLFIQQELQRRENGEETLDVPRWIIGTPTKYLLEYLRKNKKVREKTLKAIRNVLEKRKKEETLDVIASSDSANISKTELKLFRGVAIEVEELTEEIKENVKNNNLVWLFIKKINSYVVGLEIGDVVLKNDQMLIPELDDLDLLIKLISSGVEVRSNPHTYIISPS